MESLAARNLAAMAVSVYPIVSASRKKRLRNDIGFPVHTHSACESTASFRVRCGGASAGSESCLAVPVKEDFADEEDYVKAGGSELFFVQMQQNKTMDQHSKLSDKLPRIFTGDNILDLVVIGCGPAGLALAAESAKLGLNVGLVGPDLPFTNNYGVWEDEFKDLGLERCIEHVWRDTIVYLDENDPIFIGRAYGRVSRHLLHEELLKRCVESGVSYLNTKVERVFEASSGHRLVECEGNIVIPCRLATVASGAASGKLLEYEVENNPYDPSLMVFMDYRDFMKRKVECVEAQYPTFLYAMPMSPTRVFFEETCLASKDAMPFELLKSKLMSRLETMGIRIIRTYEEEWSYIPVGGSLPNTEQKNLAFGAAASMVHPATGYSVVRSLSEAPNYAFVIANILKQSHVKNMLVSSRISDDISMQAWNALWPLERKRQRAFFLFGLALILQLDIEGIRTFFRSFFRLPKWMSQGFLGSTLSSADLLLFAFYMFVIAPNDMRKTIGCRKEVNRAAVQAETLVLHEPGFPPRRQVESSAPQRSPRCVAHRLQDLLQILGFPDENRRQAPPEALVRTRGRAISNSDAKSRSTKYLVPAGILRDHVDELVVPGGEFVGARKINLRKLRSVLSTLGLKQERTLEDCKQMIVRGDDDGDGMVNFDEFRQMMKCGGKTDDLFADKEAAGGLLRSSG
ncbi:lycopene epsilon cyclase chloroplastic [Phtheirospermum japonicum]|uniref:Lycopene epsilon cyclase chloroplastic n=1 Tax=Phtheirospermum japonicum TaxID=374723 RepID=A0A830CB06_9LAMI|nr:lycopene epsilon cyclase chloroplastic [Phtheirospermum japonicum]